MANRPITMIQIQRLIQLLSLGHSQRKIARTLNISRNACDSYCSKIKGCGHSISGLLDMSGEDLAEIVLHAKPIAQKRSKRHLALRQQLDSIVNDLNTTKANRQLLWEEHCKREENPYSYTQFCEHIRSALQLNNAVMHFEHRPGEKMEVDFAGDPLFIVDPATGELIKCPVFVGVLPYSNYIYAEALADMSAPQFLSALNNCLHYFGGVPQNIVSDNMKQFVSASNRYEPTFNELAQQLSLHYNTSLYAVRVKKPRDKAHVEKSVDVVYRRVYGMLRGQASHDLRHLNHRIRESLILLNNRPMQQTKQTRHELWLKEKEHLSVLPERPFEAKYTVNAKVKMNYHITIGQDQHHYSVPYLYIGKQVSVVYDTQEVEIYHNYNRVAFHQRDYRKHSYTTLKEHMPERHQRHAETKGWDDAYFLEKSQSIGPSVHQVVKTIMESRQFSQQAYNSCTGILRLATTYGAERLEKSCQRALKGYRIDYKTVSTILKNGQDQLGQGPTGQSAMIFHENIRGASFYGNQNE